MAGKKHKGLVIVESPAKAKKIGGYLGKDYQVLASMGHVRDLPKTASEIPAAIKKEPWGRFAVNFEKDFEPHYVVPPDKKKLVKELKAAMKDADELILATDEDREGESIGWHLLQLLEPTVPVKRMVFSEITKDAIQKAIANPREVDNDLVNAQETRRVLDRLYGYTLSPLLWKKIRRGLSAGRVQSVAVRILVGRELERLAFHSGTYWDLKANLQTAAEVSFTAQLHTVGGKRVAQGRDFDEHTGQIKDGVDVLLLGETQAKELEAKLRDANWLVQSIESRNQVRNPYAPFTTSTMTQEANRKLNMSSEMTMQVAQRLYEAGHITYMRTDSVNLSGEAITAARECVERRYGKDYLSAEPRQFTNKSRNAQEAHEAIRPAGTKMKTSKELGLAGPEAKLYSLIWKRTVATQMAEAQLQFHTVTIAAADTEFRASGRHVVFPGFFRAYVEGVDDPEAAMDDQESSLPEMQEAQKLTPEQVESLPHQTKPPARFTEATLIRELEANGIGRPSTYASIIKTIQAREYIRKQSNQLIPTFTALAVTRLLEENFPNLVDIGFTAGMEETLDEIAMGTAERLPYLTKFYSGADGLNQQVDAKVESIDARSACTLQLEGIDASVRVGKFGPYFEKVREDADNLTASIPDDVAPADLSNEEAQRLFELKERGPQSLGMHPEDGLPVYVKVGPFGPYLQLGDEDPDGEKKPKRVGIPKNYDPVTIELDTAIQLMALPKRLGHHPEDNKVVNAGVGRFGPYVVHAGKYKSLGKDDDVLAVTLEQAVEMLKQAKTRSAPTALKELGKHPEDEEMIAVFEGKYGPYVKKGEKGKLNATIPKGYEIEHITLEQAIGWIEEKAAKKGLPMVKKKAKKKTAKKAKKKAKKKAG
ncbi:MAG: type I DNA topoisomerase [Planctomycetota bacterium]|nr:type I DNA topoisomerase [Planctomycetota bacterium]